MSRKFRDPADSPKIALVGCGTFAERFYLPALEKIPGAMANLVLVDSNQERARKMARRFGARRYASEYQEVWDDMDGVIIVAPYHLHYEISMDFLRHGVHVLCDKPLAQSPLEVKEMVVRAKEFGVTISTNYTQRLFPSSMKVKEMISTGVIGKLISIQYSWGSNLKWLAASGSYFDAKTSPRGVLLDWGSHPIDLICWWLGEKPRPTFSLNDSYGGPEAVAHVGLEHNGCAIDVRLSWLSDLPFRYIIRGELGTIENGNYDWWTVPIKFEDGITSTISLESPESNYFDFGRKVVANFLDVIKEDAPPLVPAASVIPAAELINELYAAASRFSLPWTDFSEQIDAA